MLCIIVCKLMIHFPLLGPCFSSSNHKCSGTQALNLLEELLRRVSRNNWNEIVALLISSPYNVLFEAAELGNLNFFGLLIKYFPDFVWVEDITGKTIFHFAIIYRRLDIFKLVKETVLCKYVLQEWKDDELNNILHLASKKPNQDVLNLVSGEALQMQQELSFFKVIFCLVNYHFFSFYYFNFCP